MRGFVEMMHKNRRIDGGLGYTKDLKGGFYNVKLTISKIGDICCWIVGLWH